MKQLYLSLALGFSFFISCQPELPTSAVPGEVELFPDYEEVTVPVNIAPLNFRLPNKQMQGITRLKTKNKEILVEAKGGVFNIPMKAWKELLQKASGESIDVSVYFKDKASDWKLKEFPIYVSPDSVDGYLTYRRIFPGYRMWHEMGIYQRNVENFVEKPVLTNKVTNNSCMNCHSFCAQQGEKMLFHQRSHYGGTYLVEHQQVKKINWMPDGQNCSLVYPYWHPSGKFIAFSTNETHQDFHFSSRNRIEVYDVKSDVVIYDVEKQRVYSSPLLNSASSFETFPTFTPDGRSLIYCSADSVPVPERYQEVKYSLLRIDFDPQTGALGEKVDTLYNARTEGRSAKFPRVSPDGKRLLYTLSDYGNFSIWHKDADLYMLDLASGATDSLPGVNSPDVESYHSWSRNSRWFVVASRRLDGLFTRPFIVYVDETGHCGKPFLLPQESPDYYDASLFSFNIPEFSHTPTPVSEGNLLKAAKGEGLIIGDFQ